jgi:hypothetical protein
MFSLKRLIKLAVRRGLAGGIFSQDHAVPLRALCVICPTARAGKLMVTMAPPSTRPVLVRSAQAE